MTALRTEGESMFVRTDRLATGHFQRQRGSVLIIGLIMMLVLTMIGLTSMQTTTLQERMSGNARDRNIAFQAAEIALRAGEANVYTIPRVSGIPVLAGAGYFDIAGVVGPVDLAAATTWPGNSVDSSAVFETAANPAYMIEKQENPRSLEAGLPSAVEVYKVSAIGVGASPNALVVLQSTFVPF